MGSACSFAVAAQALAGSAAGQSMVRGSTGGYSFQRVDASVPEQAAAMSGIATDVLPPGVAFNSLRENHLICEETVLSGLRISDLRDGLKPPPAAVANWLHMPGQMKHLAGMCPQAVMWLMLLHVQDTMHPQSHHTEQVEAQGCHMQYQILKDWLQSVVFPHEKWLDIAANWSFEALESKVWRAYKRLMSSIYNELSADTVIAFDDEPLHGVEEVGSANVLSVLTATEIHDICPGVHDSHIEVVDSADAPVTSTRTAITIVEGPVPVSMGLIGNALSLYWQARGLARLAGAAFAASGGLGTGSFVAHLVRKAASPKRGANARALVEVCSACQTWAHWRWPHLCLGAWRYVIGHVRSETRAALQRSGAEASVRAQLLPDDVVAHIRCFPFWNQDYPLPAFSLYAALPPQWAAKAGLRFLLVAGALGPVCQKMVEALQIFLQRRYPQAIVVRRFATTAQRNLMAEDLAGRNGGDQAVEEDFAMLVFAPALIRTPGSFSLWAALAREGLVISVPNPQASGWEWQEADFGPNWHWIRAPTLSEDVINRSGFIFDQPEAWIHWLETH